MIGILKVGRNWYIGFGPYLYSNLKQRKRICYECSNSRSVGWKANLK